jgi:ArsR family transcriptional regulator
MTDSRIFDRMAVLSDPTRGRILLLLAEQELAVSELCAVLRQPQSTVSRHLKVLSDDGWLASWREGTSRLYRLRGELEPEAAELWQVLRRRLAVMPAARQDRGRLASVLRERRVRSQEFFAAAAGDWDRLRGELFGARSELLPLLALLDPAWTVGDLGCGTGGTSEALAPFVRRVVAVDDSPEMLAAARRRLETQVRAGRVELRRGALEALPAADGELDAALLLLVLHHLPDPAAALAEAARVLAPGGRLVVVDMLAHDESRFRREMGHQWLGFEPARLAGWLVEAGLGAVRSVALPPDAAAQGPNLFAARAVRPAAGDAEAIPDDAVFDPTDSTTTSTPNEEITA